MQLTFASDTAVHVIRTLRARRRPLPARTVLRGPDPAPRRNWSRKLLAGAPPATEGLLRADAPLCVCVSERDRRIHLANTRNLVCAGELPRGAFLDLGDGFACSGPELAFVQYAAGHTIAEASQLGMELCGSFSRDAERPVEGPVTMGVPPVTSTARIEALLSACRGIRGVTAARKALRCVADNAWSPMESVVATMMMLPLTEYGYELGRCVLNERVPTRNEVPGARSKGTRVPDILVAGTKVGINYDGYVHLDLDSIVDAAVEVGRNPGSSQPEWVLEKAVREVRAKVVDDLRRNRDLAAAGYAVYPVVKEDLSEEGGLDGVMWQLLESLEARESKQRKLLRMALESSFAAKERYRLMRSMVQSGDAYADDGNESVDVFINLPRRRRV